MHGLLAPICSPPSVLNVSQVVFPLFEWNISAVLKGRKHTMEYAHDCFLNLFLFWDCACAVLYKATTFPFCSPHLGVGQCCRGTPCGDKDSSEQRGNSGGFFFISEPRLVQQLFCRSKERGRAASYLRLEWTEHISKNLLVQNAYTEATAECNRPRRLVYYSQSHGCLLLHSDLFRFRPFLHLWAWPTSTYCFCSACL